MKILITKNEILPFEVDKKYQTKFQTGEFFIIKKIVYRKDGNISSLSGIYETSPHLGICPINPDRLIPDKKPVESFLEICDLCKNPFSQSDIISLSKKHLIDSELGLELRKYIKERT